ncbi:ABC transporter ATP-binding protein [Phycisphaera mikurensis]|uniref:Putative ABC transporter ATP-binding protein n=1 Tax=Phycisphaera mikurensis (strain NBRC 102666 / KCTC 22515 / FYK2301M01) TaxID=1142394 RepID=I0IFA0_PHYMF|nr:ABC transporter ATP-binding protein [Phycisphaera mikurensis]MBB6440667.1 ABC-2 type transport system ATP-binding protein [Phycisphaera mikurensis]BAM03938.1 putative ABC transporter ATP-binding protein [Phycisphaera mikurensis NBRC 102666]
MISTTNLTKRYGDVMALTNLNLQIEAGQAFGFIGPNGAGKTTTIKILATLLRPTWGEARVDGLSVGPVNARQVRRIIGYVPDYFGTYQDMVVAEYLGFFAAAYGLDGGTRKRAIADVLELVGLTDKADADVNALSRGMQQRLSVARVLLHDPKVLLLDEPASGLDPRARVEMRELLKELHAMGKTILISSHILLELADLCDVVGIIESGEMRFTGTVNALMARVQPDRVLRVGVPAQAEAAAGVLAAVPGVANAAAEGPGVRVTLREDAPADVRQRVAAAVVGGGYPLESLSEEKLNLEAAFMKLTRELAAAPPPAPAGSAAG